MKRFLIRLSSSPYQNYAAEEVLELIQTLGALDQDVTLWFTGKGIEQLSNPETPNTRGAFLKAIPSLHYYGIDHILVDTESLADLGIPQDRLSVSVTCLPLDEIKNTISQYDICLPL